MKSKFFYGVFAGFILACLFFFGVLRAKANSTYRGEHRVYYESSGYVNPSAAAHGNTPEVYVPATAAGEYVSYQTHYLDFDRKETAYGAQSVAYYYDGLEDYRADTQHVYQEAHA